MNVPYPSAPWNLAGCGVQTLQWVDVRDVRKLVPPELSIVQFLPGKTLGVVAFAHYGPGSVLEYDELIIAPAVVRQGAKFGVWITHIYVDHPVSLHGGREIWGVPKELATFEWQDNGDSSQVAAHARGRTLARVEVDRRWWLFRKRLRFPTFSQRGDNIIRFVGETSGRLGWGRGKVEIPKESPFHSIRMNRPFLTLWLQEMQLICGEPMELGKTAFAEGVDRWIMQPAMMKEDALT
ncbi:acetoacetate decarboxylase family protein [bacterium]|nr:acetoacetate decarboxylase family protein [bacterium]